MLVAVTSAWVLVKAAAVLLALLVGLVLVNRRVRPRTAAGGGVVRLTPQHGVHVVELEGRRLLIGTGPSGAPRLLLDVGPSRPDTGVDESAPRVGWDGP